MSSIDTTTRTVSYITPLCLTKDNHTGCDVPRELRRIIFDEHEVIDSVASLRRMTPDFLPDGPVDRFEVIDSDHVVVEISSDEGTGKHKIDNAQLVRALVRYCQENNVPLPRKAQMRVGFPDTGLTLDMKLEGEAFLTQAFD